MRCLYQSIYHRSIESVTYMPVDASLLRNVPLFAKLEEPFRALLVERARVRTYRPDTALIHQDESGDTLYVILRGLLKVSLNRPDGREVFLTVLSPGDHFGELSLIDSKYRSANVATQEEATLVLIDRPLFDELTHSREFMLNLCRGLASRNRMGNARVANLARMSIQGLVAHHILEFAELYGQRTDGSKDIVIPIRLTQNDLADLVGASRERVNQVMKHFKDTGCISVNLKYRITVHKPAELRRTIEMQ